MVKQAPNKWNFGRTFNVKLKPGPSKAYLINYYYFGLIILKDIDILYNQIFAVFKTLKKYFKKRAFIKINCNLNLPVTRKSTSSRMGKGKGARRSFKGILKKGTVIVEISNVSDKEAFEALYQCGLKLPCKCLVKKFYI